MNRLLDLAVLAGLVLTIGVGGQSVYGQDEPGVDEARIQALTERFEARLALGQHGIRQAPGEFGLNTPAGMYIRADQFRYEDNANTVEAIGNVAVTTIRDDGSTVTIRADRMTIEEEQ